MALLVSFAVAGAATSQVYIHLDDIIPRWLITLGISAGVFITVTLLLYMPLLRHIADLIEESLSTMKARITSRKTGVGLDVIPKTRHTMRHSTTSSNRSLCSICGGPGGPVCDKCHEKMSKK